MVSPISGDNPTVTQAALALPQNIKDGIHSVVTGLGQIASDAKQGSLLPISQLGNAASKLQNLSSQAKNQGCVPAAAKLQQAANALQGIASEGAGAVPAGGAGAVPAGGLTGAAAGAAGAVGPIVQQVDGVIQILNGLLND